MRLLTLALTFMAGGVVATLLPTPGLDASQPASALDGPVAVVETVFDAARNGRFDQLPALCPPRGDHDDATRRICELRPDTPDADAFTQLFSSASVAGPPRLRAHVPIIFGPDGTQRERLELIERDGRWYFFSF